MVIIANNQYSNVFTGGWKKAAAQQKEEVDTPLYVEMASGDGLVQECT